MYQVYIDNDQITIKTEILKSEKMAKLAVSTIRYNHPDIPLDDYRVKRLSDGKIVKVKWKKQKGGE